jgi:hypothetical protein
MTCMDAVFDTRSVQGYNAQWACTAEQIIVAAQVTQASNDAEQLEPVLAVARTTPGRRWHRPADRGVGRRRRLLARCRR